MLPATESVKLSPEVLGSVQSKLASLEQALLAKDPQMPVHLREMHRLLTSYPESVHLLEDAEIKTVLAAAQEWTQTKIVTEKPKAGGSKKKVAVDDL
jgi:hypothetical protein